MDKKTKKTLLILIPSLLVAAGLTVGGWALFSKKGTPATEKGETEATNESAEPEDQAYALYWNIDGEQYFTGSETSREKDPEDNAFHINFITGGREVSLRAATKSVVNKVDARKVMGLVFDENHYISDVVDISDFTGGIAFYHIYVTEFTENHVKANFSFTGKGLSVEFDIPANVPVCNVSEYSMMRGELVKMLYPTDMLTVIANKDGSIGYIYVVERQAGIDSTHIHCECTPGTEKLAASNGHKCEDARFIPWNKEDSLPVETGYYYLNTDVITVQNNIRAGQNVVLCLNGHTVNGIADKRIYALFDENARLTVTDCTENPGTLKSMGHTDQGGVIWLRYGELTVYAGTFDASEVQTKDHPGSAIELEAKTHVTMYAGTVIGGTVPEGQGGGNVYLQRESVFDMYGGTLKGGTTLKGAGGNVFVQPEATFNMYGGSLTDGHAPKGAGGNLYVNTDAIFNAFGGTVISGGRAQTGGNVAIAKNGTLNMNGLTVQGGVVTAVINPETGKYSGGHGGNIACSGILNMKSGAIKGGKSDKNGNGGGNLTVYTNGGTANISGGTVEGGHSPNGGGGNVLLFYKQTGGEGPHLNISGGAVITGGKSDGAGGNITVADGVVTQSGGTVQNGTVTKDGANVQISSGTYVLKGGVIKNGKTPNANGGNIAVGAKGTYMQSGGTVQDGQAGIGGNIFIAAGGKAALSGGTVSGGSVDLKTTVDEKTGESKKSGGLGGNIATNGELILSGASVLNGKTAAGCAGGGNISVVGKDAVFTMTAGKVSGGSAAESGGNIKAYSENPKLTISGGEISKGSAENQGGNIWIGDKATLEFSNATVSGGEAKRGGNLYTSGTTVTTMSSGTLQGGKTSEMGGNLMVANGASFTMSGGTLEDGASVKDGGNVRNNGIFRMTGGLITNGTTGDKKTSADANFQMMGQSDTVENSFTMSGGEITGGVFVRRLLVKTDAVLLNLSGTAKITGSGLSYDKDVTEANFTVGPLSAGAEINIQPNAANLSAAFASGVNGFASAQAGCFHCTDTRYKVSAPNAGGALKLYYTEASDRWMCECGCASAASCVHKGTGHVCKDVLFKAYTASGTALPTSGNYYLTGNITTSASTLIGPGATLRLDLNGKTVTFNKRGFSTYTGDAGSTLIVSDSAGNGRFIANNDGGATTQGNVLWVVKGKALLYGGTFDGSRMQSTTMQGAALCTEANADASIIVNGATVIGGKAKYGGSIYIGKTSHFELLSGTVKGGSAVDRGGNLYLDERSTAVIAGGTVEGGSALRGGNITVPGNTVLDLRGGVITGGTSGENAGNIYVAANGTLNMSGGEISGGIATGDAGNLRTDGIFTMSGGRIYGGRAQGSDTNEAANVQSIGQNANTRITLTGGEIAGFMSVRRLVDPLSGVSFLNISGNARITGTGSGLAISNDITAQNFTFGDLSADALIRIRPNNSAPFAIGKNGFTADDAGRIVSTDSTKKVNATESAGAYNLTFDAAN